MKKILFALWLVASPAFADTTTGGINWLDPLGYTKPKFVPITVPGSATATYYIDGTSGSGSTCSIGSPCKYFQDLCGKTGMSGGPVFVYIKGTVTTAVDNFFYNIANCYGTAGAEIYVRAWPGFTANIAGGGNNVMGGDTPANTHDWIFDGGPNMDIKFTVRDLANAVAVRVNANRFTMYRVQVTCNNGSGGTGFITTAPNVQDFHVINSEFYACNSGINADQQSAVYMSSDACNGISGYSNFLFKNNIVRHMGGEGVEINPRTNSSGVTIEGNAFHDIGYNTCTTSAWSCRNAVTIDSCGGTPSGNVIRRNLMWDLAASCAWLKDGDTVVYNNTCYDYGKRLNHDGTGGFISQVNGFACGNSGQCANASSNVTIKNNIIYSPLGVDPFDDAGLATRASNNFCGVGKSCGASSQHGTLP